MISQYDLGTGLVKFAKYTIIGLLSLVVYALPLAQPEMAQVTLIGALAFLMNILKVKWGIRLP